MTITHVNHVASAGGSAVGTYSAPVAGNIGLCGNATKAAVLGLDTVTDWSLILTDVADAVAGPGMSIWKKTLTGSEAGTFALNYTPGAPSTSMCFTEQFHSSTGDPWDTADVFGEDTDTTGTTIDVTAVATIDITVGDMVVFFIAGTDDATVPIASIAMTIPGCTLSAITTIAQQGTTAGPDVSNSVGYATVTAGSASGPIHWTGTAAFAGVSRVAAGFVRLRSVPVIAPPSVPQTVTVDPGVTTADASWTTPATGDPVDDYEVRLNGGSSTLIGDVLAYELTGLTEHTTYDSPGFEVRACNVGGCSAWVEVPFQTSFEPVETTHYEVTIDGGPAVEVTELCDAFTGLEPATTYTVQVRACNEICCSDWATLEVTTVDPPVPWSPCACNPRWMVEVCQLATGQVRGVLSPTSIDIQQLLNGMNTGGTLTIPTRDVAIRDVWPDLTSVYISRLSDAGLMEGIGGFTVEAFDGRSTLQGGTATIGLKVIEQYLLHRLLRMDLSYAGQPQTNIAASLVNYALTNGIPLTGLADVSSHYRDRVYDADDRPYIGELINQLVASANGPEWVSLHTRAAGAWSTVMFFQDRVGSDHNYVLHSDIEGSEYGLRVDAVRHANSADAIADPLLGTYTDLGPYPQFDTKETLSGVTLQATLDQAAQGIVQVRGEPFAIPSFTIAGPSPAPADLRLGDSAIFHITQAAVTFNGRARIGGITWKLAEGQPEKRVLALVPYGPASQTVLNQTIADQCVSCR